MAASLSSTLATMGCAVPYAIAAKFAQPERPVIALAGDGAMQMNGLNELITIAKYRARWSDQRLAVLVLNNRDLNQVTWEQRAMVGVPKVEVAQELPDFPYARYAELVGLRDIRVDDPDRLGPAWEEELSADRPVVLEAIADPEIPSLAPHITLDQAKALAGRDRRRRPRRAGHHPPVAQAEGAGVPAGAVRRSELASRRARLIASAAGLASMSTKRRPSARQAAPSVPEPANGSRHQPPGRDEAATMRRRMPSGFCVG